jgi:predicted nucleic acid-binding protein
MIILDTNVVSEPMRTNGNPAVRDWLDRQAAETLYLTATSLSELLVGIETLLAGKRRDGLADGLERLLLDLFGSRILPFDRQAAVVGAPLIGRARAAGRAMSVADGQIAAIATQRGFSVATRDITPFAAAGVPVINPWDSPPAA